MSHVPRKRFGQNFLINEHIIAAIIAAIDPKPEQYIVEIGPGGGALTRGLLASGAHVHAIEIDRDLVRNLEEEYAHAANFTLHNFDVLKFTITDLISAKARTLRIVGNLPYNISTPLLFKLFGEMQIIQDMYFMLQREVAHRLVAQPNSKDYGRMSVMAQYHCAMHTVLDVAPDAFNPPPKVHSCVVKFTPHVTPPVVVHDHHLLQDIVTHAFNQRRKTIANSLKAFVTSADLQALEISPQLRAENLSLGDYAKITNYLAKES